MRSGSYRTVGPEIIHASIEQNLILLTANALPSTFGELAISEEQIKQAEHLEVSWPGKQFKKRL